MTKGQRKEQDRQGLPGPFSKLYQPSSLALLDERTKFGKAVAALRQQLIKDLGGDISTQESMLVERAISKSLQCAALETRLLEGHEGSRPYYVSLSNSLRLDLLALGLQRRAKDVTKTLKELLDEDRNSD